MVKAEILLQQKIKDCANCPLKNSFTRDCGRVAPENYNGGVIYRKKPKQCKMKYKTVKKDEGVCEKVLS